MQLFNVPLVHFRKGDVLVMRFGDKPDEYPEASVVVMDEVGPRALEITVQVREVLREGIGRLRLSVGQQLTAKQGDLHADFDGVKFMSKIIARIMLVKRRR